ncbi:unnamed protein product [Rhizophagus irregularis]|nr:unnamed protein product [Rhizophagus irregularis]CAB5202267.1 unnamed protein product [Rhizophagus irregularis]
MEGVKFQKGVETSMHRRANVHNNEDYYLGISLYSLSGGGNDNQQSKIALSPFPFFSFSLPFRFPPSLSFFPFPFVFSFPYRFPLPPLINVAGLLAAPQRGDQVFKDLAKSATNSNYILHKSLNQFVHFINSLN